MPWLADSVAADAGRESGKMNKSGLLDFLRADKNLLTWRKSPRGLRHCSYEPKSLMMSHSAPLNEGGIHRGGS